MNIKYIALTIGPIYKTLKNARKPKELFASSYIFSYIMREIIQEFKMREFITPYIKDDSIFDENSKVGLFHDRFIFKSEDDDDLQKLEIVIDKVCQDMAKKLGLQNNQVKDYLQFNYFEKELAKEDNPILKLSPYLGTKELFFQISQDDTFAKKLRRVKGDKDNFLTQGKNIEHNLEKLSYNKYYCIVHADGDKMTQAIEDKDNIETVSKNLFEYCKNSYDKIQKYGGQTIFAGGDDLLFFAPVLSKDKTKTIFELCEEISRDFEDRLSPATLSFGVSIKYVKFPLYEALEDSRELLFAKAKNEQRNNIAFKVTKHSGQTFETIIHKADKEVYKHFLAFTSSVNGKEDIGNFLHSIHHKIDTYKTTIKQIATNRDKLQNFFDNYFNEDIHKEEYKNFFTSLIDFIHSVYQTNSIKDKLDLVYATLRFIKFVKGDKK